MKQIIVSTCQISINPVVVCAPVLFRNIWCIFVVRAGKRMPRYMPAKRNANLTTWSTNSIIVDEWKWLAGE